MSDVRHGPAWRRLQAGAWLFKGSIFVDPRGTSNEIFDASSRPAGLASFELAQENLVTTSEPGTCRGLHYQVPLFAQAKLVTVLDGEAQFFWKALDDEGGGVHSVILGVGGGALYTPPTTAHGVLTLAPTTRFSLKMSRPVSLENRGEANIRDAALTVPFATPLRAELLSQRDRDAPSWQNRRRA